MPVKDMQRIWLLWRFLSIVYRHGDSLFPFDCWQHLRQQLEASFYEDRFDWEQVHQNDAAGLLKTFIRELPSPLLTQRYLPTFTSVLSISSQRHQIQALHLLIMLLPEPHRDTLKALLEFLRKVVAHEERNRMSLCNVSMIVAPNLFISRGKTGRPEEIQAAAKEAYLVRLLITYQDLLWRVPCFLIGHIRQMNEASMNRKTMSSEKCKKKLLRRRQPERNKGDRSEVWSWRISKCPHRLSGWGDSGTRTPARKGVHGDTAGQRDEGEGRRRPLSL